MSCCWREAQPVRAELRQKRACLPQELIELALQSANDDLKAVAWACTWAMGTRSRVVSDIGLAGERSHRES
jgi:hypothetical protein